MRSAYDLDSDPGVDWRRDAACRGYDPDWWELIGKETAENRMAKEVCADCPVTAECEDMANRTHSWGMIFAGKAYHTPARRATQWAICARCMAVFERRVWQHRFCSNECQVAYQQTRRRVA